MSYIDKEEYEERYGEHVGYCRVHHIRVLDTCQACEDDDANFQEAENVPNAILKIPKGIILGLK